VFPDPEAPAPPQTERRRREEPKTGRSGLLPLPGALGKPPEPDPGSA
jgi:hypothetical protein